MIKKSILFPAFVREYSGMENTIVKRYLPGFKSVLLHTTKITGTDLTDFDFESNNYLDNELKSQYISYLFSCELSDYIKREGIHFDYSAGYSMGIYAMFYFLGAVSKEDGLLIIKKAYESVTEIIPPHAFGMGNIIGLDKNDVKKLLADEDAEIININGIHNFFISGQISVIQGILEKAKSEGALHARMLPVGCPYHSTFIKNVRTDFMNFINSLNIKAPEIQAISCIDQKKIVSPDDVRSELTDNLVTPLNWLQTIINMNENGIHLFYECGAGNSLTKLNKFIAGEHSTLKYNLIEQLFEL